jgi:hypothetical protein
MAAELNSRYLPYRDRFFHLGGKFACGREHQGADADATKFATRRRGAAEFVQHWQHKGGRLAGAGLRTTEQVLPVQYHRNGLRLDRRWGFIALLKHGFDDGRSQD